MKPLEEEVGELLRKRQFTLGVAESCTGGLICHRLTNVPGSSDYLERGVVVYSNRAKVELLDVPSALLEAHGAVSQETAEAMARGVRALARSEVGVAVTGVAGPGGGSAAKPVGTVFMAVTSPGRTRCEAHRFSGDRLAVKAQAAEAALALLRRHLLEG